MVRGGRGGFFCFGGDQAFAFQHRINPAADHHGEEIIRHGLRLQDFSGCAVLDGEIGERGFGDLAFFEGG